MGTHKICLNGEIRKILVLFWLKKCIMWSYEYILPASAPKTHFLAAGLIVIF